MLYTWFIDADGTLWRHSPVREALLSAAETIGLRGLDEYYSVHRALLRRGRYLEAYDWHMVAITVAERHHVSAGTVLRSFEYGLARGLEELSLLPGVEEVLEEAVGQGVRLVVVSNGLSKYIDPPLTRSGLSKYFAGVVTPDRVRIHWAPVIKPHRPIFTEAAKRAPANHYTVIGDTYVDDVLGGLLWGVDRAFLLGEEKPKQLIEDGCAAVLDGRAAQWYDVLASCNLSLGDYVRVSDWYEIRLTALERPCGGPAGTRTRDHRRS